MGRLGRQGPSLWSGTHPSKHPASGCVHKAPVPDAGEAGVHGDWKTMQRGSWGEQSVVQGAGQSEVGLAGSSMGVGCRFCPSTQSSPVPTFHPASRASTAREHGVASPPVPPPLPPPDLIPRACSRAWHSGGSGERGHGWVQARMGRAFGKVPSGGGGVGTGREAGRPA